ncbi:glycosyl hydrolase [Oceanispirochaeta crateris]|uniref:Glycosyl hydrolase n=1 Tax=Oceanispirochaeta crateris TaxID=2518645 RepID=A0A5C1QMB7_9SPIO|nr:glycosyl hydrolase [Oceanispirochaeta crateris]QEN08110.1 glycosyl hydrolase [Oceanispirochaeta crateris]
MIKITQEKDLKGFILPLNRFFDLAVQKVELIQKNWDEDQGAPVFTINGKYSSRGWTEWTQGFMYGNALLAFEATGNQECLHWGREKTVEKMAPHLSHFGVHDHGFNNISSYGNLLRFMKNGEIEANEWEKNYYILALKLSGAVQAKRFTYLPGQLGYVTSFNGAHSLFADTIRSMRILALSHQLGHFLWSEQDEKTSLLKLLLSHAETTARYNVYFGEGRDTWDERGRVAHESIFNVNSGSYRCPASQQGYSPFTTWTRGQAWILTGFAEQLEFISTLDESEISNLNLPYYPDKKTVLRRFKEVAEAVADHIIENSPTDGIPYWDTGAPQLHKIKNYKEKPADPYNGYEPVDSSSAAISVQGLFRLASYLKETDPEKSLRYSGAATTMMKTLLSDEYLSLKKDHQGLLLHSIYHQPNGWDHVAQGQAISNGESCMWGDYHLLEAAVYLQKMAIGKAVPEFFNI